MADFAAWDEGRQRYVLGPPLAPAQEIYDHTKTVNSPFELAYWNWALRVAQSWRERLDLPRDPHWDDVIDRLSPLTVIDGLYVGAETCPDSFSNNTGVRDHPTMLAPLGLLPGIGVNRTVMEATLRAVLSQWQ